MLLIGTAGHIDHGKSTLVKALTGIDPSRLPEEKKRGMTIDLGYAYLKRKEGDVLGFIDVPGHEKLIRNMVAGATGMDAALLVVHAREGVKPQTCEHLEVLRLLGISPIIIALTHCTLAENTEIEKTHFDLSLLFGSAEKPIFFHIDSLSGLGIEQLKSHLISLHPKFREDQRSKPLYFPVDRSFQLKGQGAIVTGSLQQGALRTGDEITLSSTGKNVRVRALTNHNSKVYSIGPGHRVGVQPAGISSSEIKRGHLLLEPGAYSPTNWLQAKLHLSRDFPGKIKNGDTLLFYAACMEKTCRVWFETESKYLTGNSGEVPLHLQFEKPDFFYRFQPFLLRATTPLAISGGGILLGGKPERPRKISGWEMESLQIREDKLALLSWLENSNSLVHSLSNLSEVFLSSPQRLRECLAEEINCLIESGDNGSLTFLPSLQKLGPDFERWIVDSKSELKRGIGIRIISNRFQLPERACDYWMQTLLSNKETYRDLLWEKEILSSRDKTVAWTSEEEGIYSRLVSRLEKEGAQSTFYSNMKKAFLDQQVVFNRILKTMKDRGELVEINKEYFLLPNHFSELMRKAESLKTKSFSPSEFGAATGLSRKFSIPLLEYLDRRGITKRVEKGRVFAGRPGL